MTKSSGIDTDFSAERELKTALRNEKLAYKDEKDVKREKD